MPTYMMFARYTDRGIQHVKEAPTRIENFKKMVRALGGEIEGIYLMLGSYDTVCLISVPDDETMTKVALTVGSWGSVRTETIRLFAEADFCKLVCSLPTTSTRA
jgi:uncharacterized protein with GYD domain